MEPLRDAWPGHALERSRQLNYASSPAPCNELVGGLKAQRTAEGSPDTSELFCSVLQDL